MIYQLDSSCRITLRTQTGSRLGPYSFATLDEMIDCGVAPLNGEYQAPPEIDGRANSRPGRIALRLPDLTRTIKAH